MSWFDGHDVDDIPDNPNELPNNTYLFEITQASVGETKSKDKTGITFRYQIMEGPYSNFFPLVDWVRVPDGNTKPDEIERMLSYLKMRLLAFGFSIDEIKSFDASTVNQCIGRRFYGTTSLKKQDDGNNSIRVQKFDPIGEGGDTMVDFGDNSDNPDDKPF